MTASDEVSFERASARILRSMAALAALGTLAAWVRWGWRAGLGFLFGAFISWLNFVLLHGLITRLAGSKPRRRTLFLALRWPLLAACAYVMVRFTPISFSAALAGIFVFTAAVFIEVAFEIAHARK